MLNPNIDGPNAAATRYEFLIFGLTEYGRRYAVMLTSVLRSVVFMSLAFSGVAPIAHVAITQGSEGLEKLAWANIAITCVSYAVGMVIYIYRVPERIWLGRFDIWVCIGPFFFLLKRK